MARLPSNVLRVRHGANVKYRIRWTDAGGKRRSANYASADEAKVALAERLAEVTRTRDEERAVREGRAPAPPAPPPEMPTFKAWVEEFTRTYVAANNKPSERVNKEKCYRLFLVPAFGEMRLDAIGAREIEALKASMLATPTRGREGYSRKSINNVLICLGKTLRYALEVGVLEKVPRVRALKLPPAAFSFLEADELARLAAAGDDDTRAAVLLAGDAGLRSGEIRALHWEDVDLRLERVTVRRGAFRDKIDSPKGGRARTIPLTARLAGTLRAIRHLRGPLVFATGAGELRTEKDLTCALWRACKRAALRRVGFHTLRHTFCSLLAMRGAPPRTIQELAGHADLKTTQRYLHLGPHCASDAIRLLEATPRSGGSALPR